MTLTTRLAVALSSILLLGGPARAEPIAGITSGVFVNPVGQTDNGPAHFVGVGTNAFSWGQIGFGTPQNSVAFTGTTFDTSTETDFQIGSFTYYNGSVAVGTSITAVDLSVTLGFTTPPIPPATFTFTFEHESTPNEGPTPEDDADLMRLPGTFAPQTFLLGDLTYTIALLASATRRFRASYPGTTNWPSRCSRMPRPRLSCGHGWRCRKSMRRPPCPSP
jgi:hypothetical protein